MADASVDIVFNNRGLVGAERQSDKLADSIDKVDDKAKKLAKTEKKAAASWSKDEKQKQLAVKKTELSVKKLEATQKMADERRTRRQQVLSAISKIGGQAGGVVGAAGEGVGTGSGGLIALGIIGAGAAVGLAALSASADRAAQSVTNVANTANKLEDSIDANIKANQQRAVSIGKTDANTINQLRALLTTTEFRQVQDTNQRGGQAGFLQAILAAKQAGVFKDISVAQVSQVIQRGQPLGETAGAVVGRLTAAGSAGRKSDVRAGRVAQTGLGRGSEFDIKVAESRVVNASESLATAAQQFVKSESAIQSASIALFESGKAEVALRTELVSILEPEAVARRELNKELNRQIEIQMEIARTAPPFLELLKQAGSIIGLTESAAQQSVRAINEASAGLQ